MPIQRINFAIRVTKTVLLFLFLLKKILQQMLLYLVQKPQQDFIALKNESETLM
jgi:hypothetical protein